MFHDTKKSFTLIEMLIVIVIIGILAAALVPRLVSVQGRARDTKRKTDLNQLSTAIQIRHADTSNYPATVWWFNTGNSAYVDLTGYMTAIPYDPSGNAEGPYTYQYWRKDYDIVGVWYTSCTNVNNINKYVFLARLENVSDSNWSGVAIDSLDTCMRNSWGMSYKAGN